MTQDSPKISFPVILTLFIFSLIAYSLTIHLTIKPRFHFKTRKNLKKLGTVIFVLLACIALVRNLMSTIGVILFYGGISTTLMMNKMTCKYIDLIERRMTFKEEVARKKACKTYRMQDDFKNSKKMSSSNKHKNLYRFLCTRKTPKSMLRDDRAIKVSYRKDYTSSDYNSTEVYSI